MSENIEENDTPSNEVDTERLDINQVLFEKLTINRQVVNPTKRTKNHKSWGGYASKTPKEVAARRFIFEEGSKPEKKQAECNFYKKGLTSLSTNFASNFKHLMNLDLRENSFSDFPKAVLQLLDLRILRLDQNQITSVPPGIVRLSRLQILTLSRNRLTRIELSLSKLTSLTGLILSENAIEEWPNWLCVSAPLLKVLHLHNNPAIPGIPVQFYLAKNLSELSFDWFNYLLPNVGKVLKDEHGQFLISQTKELCRRLEHKVIESMEIEPHCGFSDFLCYFMKLRQSQMMDPIYTKSRTPFHVASIWGHTGVIKEYLKFQHNLNKVDEEGSTALTLALRSNQKEVVQLLMKNGRIDKTISSSRHGSPLHISILREMFDVATVLASVPHFNKNITDGNNNNILHYLFAKFDAAPKAITEICDILLLDETTKINSYNKRK